MKTAATLFVLTLGIVLGRAAPLLAATPAPEPKIFDVRAFGAKGDGAMLDTAAIQKALDACGEAGGGTVRFPAGTYLSKPLTIRNKTTVQLETGATLLASTNQSDFMRVPGDWLQARGNDFIPLISGRNLTDVTFTGSGVIDGSGAVWWDEAEKARQLRPGYTLPRPNLLVLDGCTNVRLENITLRNSPKYHLLPSDCEDVVISNVTILAPEHAANTDAIDPSGRRILITKCKIDVGDDNIAIKAGRNIPSRAFESEDITITDCAFLHGHGMSIGSETSAGVHNITVKNCTFAGTENGIRIKSDVRRGGLVENLNISDISMTNVDPAITFTCYYANNSAGDAKQAAPAQTNAPAAGARIPMYRDIHISNLTATCQKSAGVIMGLPESCISNVVFENVHITAQTGFTINNAKAVQFKNSTVKVTSGAPFTGENAEVNGL